ncbi:hypothetical protein BD310DRAFT_826872 [Dichomitus squalens]|uniref:DNA polymerase beta n=1 Tax=Dichomitus squalens TaxID=114155 RepID=A0A4Q9PL92_9APHY|nr:hypothetical protein BD310DRAFT_826872 [Dichomitus squalens]
MSSARALGSSEARTEASGSRVRVPQDPTASKRTARTKPFEVPQGVKHHAPIADSSNITSPTSTAPGVANPATAKGAVEKKGKVTVVAKQATAKRGATSAQKPKGKGKRRELITASEYAKMKNAEAEERRLNGRMPAAKQFLEGKRIFYYGADLNYAGEDTQRRMDIIIKHGGTLIPDYDPDQITHIVVSKNTGAKALLKVIGLRRLKDIPQRIPTVTWDWIQTGFSAPRDRIDVADEDDPLVYKMGWLFEYAAYSERIDAGETPWGEYMAGRKNLSTVEGPSGVNGGRSTDVFPTSDVVDDSSHISDFTQDKVLPGDGVQIMPYAGLPSPPSSPSYPSLGTLLPHYTKVAGKVVQAVQSISGNGGSWQDTAVHAENHVVDPAMRYAEDPLAEFYAQARAERNAEMFGHDESDSESITPEKEQISRTRHRKREAVKKGVFICDDKGGKRRQATCPNQDVIDKLEELKALHDVKPGEDDRWRVYGLNKAIAALRRCPTRIRTLEEAMKLNGVGEKTARKIIEIIQTGDLMRIQYETTEDIKAVKEFTGIYGVGANTARTWFNNGCRTLEDIAARKGGVKLSHAQEIGLRYYRDINTRIPRAEVQEIYDKIKGEALKLDPKLFIQVMGSFRRGKSTCGDIDILISRPVDDGKTHQGILRRLLAELHRQDIVTEDLCLPDNFEDLELVYRGLCRKGPGSLRRRIDFLTVPWVSRGAALLYYTGDDIFNRSLRLKANKMGYSLNQRGLYADVIRNKDRQKVTEGVLVASESEREILDILGVPWQEPHERVRH